MRKNSTHPQGQRHHWLIDPEPIRMCGCCCGGTHFFSGGCGLDAVPPSLGLLAKGRGVLITGRITLVTTVDATLTAPMPKTEFAPSEAAEEERAAAGELEMTDWPDETEKETVGAPPPSAANVLLSSPSPPPFLLCSENPPPPDRS